MFDGAGDPVDDALIEIWQANRAGRYRHPEDDREELPLEDGLHRLRALPDRRRGPLRVRHGQARARRRPHAPHINVIVLARGLLRHLFTRIYFPDEAEANAADPLLSSIEDAARARDADRRPLDGVLRFDIHLQGERQTVFLRRLGGLFTPIFVPEAVQDAVADAAWLRAMLDVEAALAAAEAAEGVIPADGGGRRSRRAARRRRRARRRGARGRQPGRAAGARRCATVGGERRLGALGRDEPGRARQRGDAGRARGRSSRCWPSSTRSSRSARGWRASTGDR